MCLKKILHYMVLGYGRQYIIEQFSVGNISSKEMNERLNELDEQLKDNKG